MSTALMEETVTSHTDDGSDDLTHLYCPCNEDIALCGGDIADNEYVDWQPDEILCVVCDDMDKWDCVRCGL